MAIFWQHLQDTPGASGYTTGVSPLTVTNFTNPVGLGHTVIVFLAGTGDPTTGTLTVTDNALFPNTYTSLAVSPTIATPGWVAIFAANILSNPTSGNLAPKATSTGGTVAVTQIAAMEFIGRFSAVDALATSASGVGGTAAPGPIATGFPQALLLASAGVNFTAPGPPVAAGTSGTQPPFQLPPTGFYAYQTLAQGGNFGAFWEYSALALSGQNPTWPANTGSPSSSRYWSCCQAALKGYSMLITPSQVQLMTDRLAALYEQERITIGLAVNQVSPLVPSMQNIANNLVSDVIGTNNADFQGGLLNSASNLLSSMNVERFGTTFLKQPVNEFNAYVARAGITISSLIVNLNSFLAFYNGGAGGLPFANLLTWPFGDLWFASFGNYLLNVSGGVSNGAIMSPYIGPANGQSNGMGTAVVAGSYTQGASVVTTQYSEVQLVAVVTTNFASGTAAPTLTVNGTDNTGAAQTWTGALPGGNNPTTALTQQTVSSGAITAQKRSTVTVGSTTGIAVGSVLTINLGKPDQELVWVEAVPSGTTFTAVFLLNHTASATVDGNNAVLLTPGTAGRRARTISNIVFSLTGHTAGAVRVDGVLDRRAV